MPTRKTKKILSGMAAAVLLLVGGADIVRRQADLPSLPVLVDLQFDLTPRSQTYTLFDAVPLQKSTQPAPLPMALAPLDIDVPWDNGQRIALQRFLDMTHTHAFLVVQDGKIVHEYYIGGFNAQSRFASFSVAKSFVTTLTGAALAEGKIASLDDPISKYLKDDEISPNYRHITVGQLAAMQSGIDVDEDYDDSLLSPVVRMYVSTDLGKFIKEQNKLRFAPGSQFEYRSVDTLVLGRVLTRATGQSLTSYAQRTLWEPLGMEADASWSVDSDAHRVEKAFCCLNAPARDFVKLGLLYLAKGKAGDNQVISERWTQAPGENINGTDTLGYRDGWWIPPGNAQDRDFSAIGVFGQYIYINPATRTVIVKLSDHGVEQDEVATLLAMRAISHHLAGKPST